MTVEERTSWGTPTCRKVAATSNSSSFNYANVFPEKTLKIFAGRCLHKLV